MKFDIWTKSLETAKTDAVVVFAHKTGDKKPKLQIKGGTKGLNAYIQESFEQKTFSSNFGDILFFRNVDTDSFLHLVVVGVGDGSKVNEEGLRRLAARAFRRLKIERVLSASFCSKSLGPAWSRKTDRAAHAICEGMMMAAYDFSDFKSSKSLKHNKDIPKLEEVHIVISGAAAKAKCAKAVKTASTLADAVNFARWMGDCPGNFLTPSRMATETIKAAKGSKLKVTFWDKARIKKEKLGLLMGVSAGSAQEPRLIIMEYKGAAASKKPVCFVGKGLTFDSGGISLKPSNAMEEMKYDMCGGATVIATMLAIARLGLKINAIAYVPASENLTGPAATKPGDILVARNEITVEVDNTDAEGRLILGDALCVAVEKKPAVIIDAATLTGAIVVALGTMHTGFFTQNDKLRKQINSAATATGESVWELPLAKEHCEDMRGTYADLNNISRSREAGSAHGAGFLSHFVPKDIPWAHFDIAGTAWKMGKRLPYCPATTASGIMVRTFVEFAKNW